MKHILTIILFLATLTVAAQDYSPCYTNNIAKGDAAFSQCKYSEAKTYYVTAKKCNGGNPTEAKKKISACDAKIKEQKEKANAEEAKRIAEEKAEETRRKEEQKVADAKKRAEEEAAASRRMAENEDAEKKRIADNESKGIYEIKGVSFKMVFVEGGKFNMGCMTEQDSSCIAGELPVHSVIISDFYMGETEVTQALWKAVMGYNPSHFKDDNLPVESVCWNECQKFIVKLNELTGKKFRLPTEVEWEYAARGGNKSLSYKYAGSNNIQEVAWYGKTKSTANGRPHPVKTKSPNEIGLYDMCGNVWERCSDWWGLYGKTKQIDPKGPSSGSTRVLRGGGWDCNAWYCRVTCRYNCNPIYNVNSHGLRLVMTRK